jgi:hypothetical protein
MRGFEQRSFGPAYTNAPRGCALASDAVTAAKELEGFFAKYDPAIVAVAKRALAKLRKRMPGAMELVYDNYNALVIGFGASEKLADVVCSIALYPKWVTLFFLKGKKLRDPEKRLAGSGATVRSIRLEGGAKTLDEPAVLKLLAQAIALSPIPKQKRRMVIRAVSKKQRPRRPR